MVDLRDMLPGALAEINSEILLATIRAFAKRGFCGDLSFRFDGQQVLRTRHEIYRPEISVSSRWEESVEENRAAFQTWLSTPQTILIVRFNQGEITNVQSRDEVTT